MSFYDQLISILENVQNSFGPDELAYLAVTSKIENPLRDRIAYALHAQFGQAFLVHREWKDPHNKKADIAITDMQNNIECLIECKAHSAPTYQKGYSRLALEDLRKMYNSSEEGTELYFIFFLNHVHSTGRIEERFKLAIKYWDLLNKALDKYDYAPDMAEHVGGHWLRHMNDIGLNIKKSRSFKFVGGTYYNMQVNVYTHLYGPVKRDELMPILR